MPAFENGSLMRSQLGLIGLHPLHSLLSAGLLGACAQEGLAGVKG